MLRFTWALMLALAAPVQAQQFVFLDVLYEHTDDNTNDSHYYVNAKPTVPKNWVSPINYAGGSAVIHLEVITKPTGNAPTRYQACFSVTPYECTQQVATYRTTGTYQLVTRFADFYKSGAVENKFWDWSKGAPNAALILKDDMNRKPAPENTSGPNPALYTPTKLRVVLTIVAPGATYVPPLPWVDPTPPDAGTPDAGEPDAGEPPDSGTVDPLQPQPSTEDTVTPIPGRVNGGCSSTGGVVLGSASLLLAQFLNRRRRKG